MREKLLAFFASQPYYRCALLIGLDVARLERQADELAHDAGWPLVSVGRRLSLALRSTPPGQRPRTAQQSLQEVLSHAEPVPLVCTHIDLLFEPTLHLDPLALFREASRSVALVVAWPGCYDGCVLSYAVPEHAHYRTWIEPQVHIHGLAP